MASLFYITGGFDWIDGAGDGWLDKTKHECEWNGNDISYSAESEVEGVGLSGVNLSGCLPVKLSLLTELTSLDLRENHLKVPIPFHPI